MGDNGTTLLYVIGINKELTDPRVRYILDMGGFVNDNQRLNITDLKTTYAIGNNEDVSIITWENNLSVSADKIILLPVNGSEMDGVCYVANNKIVLTPEHITAVDGSFTETTVDQLLYKGLSTEINSADLDALTTLLTTLRKDIAEYYKQGASITDPAPAVSFNAVLANYIKVANELLNVPMFKKILSLPPDDIKPILPVNERDDMYNELISAMNIQIDFTQFKDATPENQQVLNLLLGKDAEKGTATYGLLETPRFRPVGNSEVKTISLSDFANDFLYRIKQANYNYDRLSGRIKTVPTFMNFMIAQLNESSMRMKSFLTGRFLSTITADQAVQRAINAAIRSKLKTNILTFLKIRNDDGAIYNRRFDVQLNSTGKHKIMNLKYNDDNLPYYVEDAATGNLVPTPEVLDHTFAGKGNLDMALKPGEKYDRNYLFGEFTQIFTPDQTNADIAKQMDIIIEMLTSAEPKPVFILGYGASGAGKTSSLIYYNKGRTPGEQNGILIQLCNQLGQSDKYTHIELEYREMYHSGDEKDFTETPVYTDCETVVFTYKPEVNGFVLDKLYAHQNHHTYRISKELGQDCTDPANATTEFAAGTPIGEIMIHLIDKDRHVKATTNNPNSSRSHSLIFVKLSKPGETTPKQAHLIVGDFAGVENVFDCENPAVLTDFMNIKEDKVGSTKLFYEEEKCEDTLDPIGSETSQCTPQNGGGSEPVRIDGGAECNKANLPIYDFENPELTAPFKECYPILESFPSADLLRRAIFCLRSAIGIKGANLKRVKDESELARFYTSENRLLAAYKASYQKWIGFRERMLPLFAARDNAKSAYESYKTERDSYNRMIEKLQAAASPDRQLPPFSYKSLLEADINKVFKGDSATIAKLLAHVNSSSLYKNLLKSPKTNQQIYGDLQTLFRKPVEPVDYTRHKVAICTQFLAEQRTFSDLAGLINGSFGRKTYVLNMECTGDESIDELMPEVAPSIQKILAILFAEDAVFYTFVKEMDYNRTKRLNLAEAVCVNRKTEGTFINDSLKQVRNVLREMLYEKNKDALAIVPNYIDICFDKYCPTHEHCFSFNSPAPGANPTKSVVFDEIFKYLAKDMSAYTKEKMYTDLLVCVFCVFNISKRANNPPPVPYVDINELKRVVYNYDLFDEKYTTAFVKAATTLIDAIETKYVYSLENGSKKNRVDGLKTIPIGVVEDKSPAYRSLKDNTNAFVQSKTAYELFGFLVEQFRNRPSFAGGAPVKLGDILELDRLRLEMLKFFANNKNMTNTQRINSPQYFAFVEQYKNLFPGEPVIYKEMATNLRTRLSTLSPELNKKYTLYKNPSKNENTIEEIEDGLKMLANITETYLSRMNAVANIATRVNVPASKPTEQSVPEVNPSVIKNNWDTMQSADMKPIIVRYLIDFIEAVDNSNAVSAVGTIEFIDRLAKLNTVATLCNDVEALPQISGFIEQFGMKSLEDISSAKKTGGRRVKTSVNRTKKRR